MLAPATAQRSLDAIQPCHNRLTAKGIDLNAFNSVENAADVADLRTATGIDSWHVYGVSYGTDLALQLMRDHPEGISSVVLDSVAPPQNSLLTHLWGALPVGIKRCSTPAPHSPPVRRPIPTSRMNSPPPLRGWRKRR
jgi:pimeloyl-ACP methyl ester carboxylesterase